VPVPPATPDPTADELYPRVSSPLRGLANATSINFGLPSIAEIVGDPVKAAFEVGSTCCYLASTTLLRAENRVLDGWDLATGLGQRVAMSTSNARAGALLERRVLPQLKANRSWACARWVSCIRREDDKEPARLRLVEAGEFASSLGMSTRQEPGGGLMDVLDRMDSGSVVHARENLRHPLGWLPWRTRVTGGPMLEATPRHWVCVDLVARLARYAEFRPRSVELLRVLHARAVVWGKEVNASDLETYRFRASSVLMAFRMGAPEVAALQQLQAADLQLTLAQSGALGTGDAVITHRSQPRGWFQRLTRVFTENTGRAPNSFGQVIGDTSTPRTGTTSVALPLKY